MKVNKKKLAEIFNVDPRTIERWQSQGLPCVSGGGKGVESVFDTAMAIQWYAQREADIENEKLRKEVEDYRAASEADLQPGTIEYERHRLTRAQADAQELKNARDSAEVVETAFCTFVLSRIAGEIASILDGIPLSVQRRFPELDNRHIDFLKRDIIKAMNKAAALDELISDKIGRRIPYIIMNTSAIVLAWPMLSIIVDKSYAPSTIMVALIVIHNCAVLGLFALENITMAEMFGCKNRFTRMAISKEIGGLIASGFGPILAGIFCTMTESWYPIAIMIMAYSVIGLISALKMPEVKDRDLSALEDAAEDQPRVVRAAQPSRSL